MTSGPGAGSLSPTFTGFVHTSMDGLILFEACLSGKLNHVPRRPHDRERATLIKSGSVFIYEENASGIKRWTDGVAWSPSRILGNFLIYRELEKPFPPGEKKRAMKRKRTSLPGEPYPRRPSDDGEDIQQHHRPNNEITTPLTPPTPNPPSTDVVKPELPSSDQDKELERSLIGSLVDSYGFRPDGLVKKTMSISINGISHHMVSYYKVDDVKNNKLARPLTDPRLQNLSVRPELYMKQNFRAPIEETEQYAIDGHMHAHPQMVYSSMGPQGYAVRPGQYFGGQHYPGMYSMATTGANMYGAPAGTSWPQQQPGVGAVAYANPPGYPAPNYGPYYKNQPPQAGKQEDQPQTTQPMPYGGQYASSSYPGAPRNGSQSTPTMVQSSYHTPVQQNAPNFNSMANNGGGRQSYSGGGGGGGGGGSGNGGSVSSPTGNSHHPQSYPQSAHSVGSQPYAVRSPSQSYGMHTAPQSAVSQSPHPTTIKSPQSATIPGTPAPINTTDSQMNYRTNPYPVPHTPQSAHPSGGEMNGLGITGATAPYTGQPPSAQSYAGPYGSAPAPVYRQSETSAHYQQ